jgi:hypothetical protein
MLPATPAKVATHPHFRTTPRIETGDPRYEWLNQTIFVAEGRLQPGRVIEYKVYRVA